MKAIIFTVLFLIFSLSMAVPYDYLSFASFWGGSSCKLIGCKAAEVKTINKNFFNIHGLWPDYYSGYPSNCDNTTVFNASVLTPGLRDLLASHWSGLISPTSTFHNHEWTKHGTCWNDVKPSQNNDEKMANYFSLAIDYALNLDIYGVLESNGIVPNYKPYQLSQFLEVLDVYWGKNTYILECSTSSKVKEPHLNAVYNCLDLDMKMIECPAGSSKYFKVCKPGPVYYVPIDL